MHGFGEGLRELRRRRGWRQQDLADALDGMGRSTIANLETGREKPSLRFFERLVEIAPEAEELRPAFLQARGDVVWSPTAAERSEYAVEQLNLVYGLRSGGLPDELIESRRIRALRDGVHAFELEPVPNNDECRTRTTELLWGGFLEMKKVTVHGRPLLRRRVRFPAPLRRGDAYEFALRTWSHDALASPILLELTRPVDRVELRVNFWGKTPRPEQAWAFGPAAHEEVPGLVDGTADGRTELLVERSGAIGAAFLSAQPKRVYGITWTT